MAKTAMSTDLLQAFQIFTKLGVNNVGHNLAVFTIANVLLSVEHPLGDLVLKRISEDFGNAVDFFISEFTSSFIDIDISFAANNESKATTNTLIIS